MNERIKELVGQAKFIAEETINKKISKNAELDAFADKFAQLIVRECADYADMAFNARCAYPGDYVAESMGRADSGLGRLSR